MIIIPWLAIIKMTITTPRKVLKSWLHRSRLDEEYFTIDTICYRRLLAHVSSYYNCTICLLVFVFRRKIAAFLIWFTRCCSFAVIFGRSDCLTSILFHPFTTLVKEKFV